jgi:hypothetical protein
MNLDELTLGQLKEIKSLCGISESTTKETGSVIKIVVLQRGWVVVGRYVQNGSNCKVVNGYVIRRWGTNEGLGQLATEGPQSETKLEPTPTIRFHELTVIQTIDCEDSKWAKHCPQA